MGGGTCGKEGPQGRVKPEVLRCLRSSSTTMNQTNRARPPIEASTASRPTITDLGEPLSFAMGTDRRTITLPRPGPGGSRQGTMGKAALTMERNSAPHGVGTVVHSVGPSHQGANQGSNQLDRRRRGGGGCRAEPPHSGRTQDRSQGCCDERQSSALLTVQVALQPSNLNQRCRAELMGVRSGVIPPVTPNPSPWQQRPNPSQAKLLHPGSGSCREGARGSPPCCSLQPCSSWHQLRELPHHLPIATPNPARRWAEIYTPIPHSGAINAGQSHRHPDGDHPAQHHRG